MKSNTKDTIGVLATIAAIFSIIYGLHIIASMPHKRWRVGYVGGRGVVVTQYPQTYNTSDGRFCAETITEIYCGKKDDVEIKPWP